MKTTRSGRRRRVRAVALGVTLVALLVAAASFAGASGAQSGAQVSASDEIAGYPAPDPDAPWAWQRFLAQTPDDVERLGRLGVDVNEGTAKNPDGSAWLSVLVTDEQRQYL